jgi:methanogenic corrinoid protein MtbC1
MPPHELITHTILPGMVEIGRRWERNDLAIYEEHLATETIIRLLAGLSAGVPKIEHNKLSALVSCVPNDKHQLLPMALSEYLELRGWRVCSLGSSLPAEQIALAASTLKPNAIFLSLNMLSRLSDALDVLEKLHKDNSHCPIFIGGHGTFAGRLLLEEAQASVTQDFDEAHRLALIGGTTYA